MKLMVTGGLARYQKRRLYVVPALIAKQSLSAWAIVLVPSAITRMLAAPEWGLTE